MMKITPLEIRQKSFEKIFRGYDKEEVASFLNFLSQEWEKINEEKRMLQMKLEQSEKESAKLRQVEDSLFKTLKTAEDTGASMVEQANKTAELILKETHMNAEVLQTESRKQAQNVVEYAEAQAKSIMEDLREDVAALIESYETLLAQREIVLKNLKNIAADTMENVNFAKEEIKRIDVTAHAKLVKELNRQGSYSVASDRAYKEVKQTIVTQMEPEYVQEEKQQTQEEQPEEPEMIDEMQVAGPSVEEPAVETEESHEEPPVETEKAQEEPPIETEKAKEEKPIKRDPGSFFDQFD